MATNHTENYQLNLWEPGDAFLRTEFNENFQKIDGEVKGELDKLAFGNCHIEVGSYVGTGTYGRDNPVVLDFADTAGKAPAMLYVGSYGYDRFLVCRGMYLYYPERGFEDTTYCINLTWTETGVRWNNSASAKNQLNISGTVYTYCAFFD